MSLFMPLQLLSRGRQQQEYESQALFCMGIFCKAVLPVALSASNAIPHACTPPM